MKGLTLPMLRLLLSKTQELEKSLKIIQALSSWYSLESSHRLLSDEYPFARVSVIFELFSYQFGLIKLATSSIRVKCSEVLMAILAGILEHDCSSPKKSDWLKRKKKLICQCLVSRRN